MLEILTALREALATIPGVKTCRVGLEPNITPEDYPLIRIVPSRVTTTPNPIESRLELLVYFGLATYESTDGLESVYAELLDLDAKIRSAMRRAGAGFGVRLLETICDEDRLEHYKLFASRYEAKILNT